MEDKRRIFLRNAALGGGLTAFAASFSTTAGRMLDHVRGKDQPQNKLHGNSLKPEFSVDPASGKLSVNPEQQVSYTMCMGCTTFCGVRVRIDKPSGKVLRVAGNPYSPMSADPALPYQTPVRDSFVALSRFKEKGLAGRSTACGRGNAVLEQMESPFRVLAPMKRVGPRGGGRWQPIAFEQLVKEITEGGNLFGEGPVQGLRALRELDTPIDPQQPELGPRVNQVGLMASTDDGRLAFADRFFKQSYGSLNMVNHGSYCGGAYRSGSGAMFGDMKKMPHAKADLENVEFCLFVGTAPGNAGNPFKRQGTLVAKARSGQRQFNYVVVDPVLTNADSLASGDRSRWVPIKPGTDGALAMAMIRWIIEERRYDRSFLVQPNLQVAEAAGEAAWCNASHLVISQPGHPRDGRYLRASDMGLELPEDERYQEQDPYVVFDAGTQQALAHTAAKGEAELFFDAELQVGGQALRLKSAMTLLREEACRHTLADYSAACGVPADVIVGLARELTSHGKRAAVNAHGGMMAGSGFYNAYSLVMLNTLIGNLNRKGGTLINGGSFKDAGPGPRYNLESFAGQIKPAGTPIGRNVAYEKSAEFKRKKAQGKGYPAQAPWYPNAPALATEWLTSAMNGYPYGLKALILWSCNPLYGVPGLRAQIEHDLADPKKLPLIVAVDPFINESSAFADYLVPDSLLYESWGWAGAWGGVAVKMSTARWPVVEAKAAKLPDGQAIGMETFFIALAKAMQLPGFGPGGLSDSDGVPCALERPEHWYLRGGANIAWQGKTAVPEASDDDIALSGVARIRPLLEAALKPEEWRKVAFMLARGGRYQSYGEMFGVRLPPPPAKAAPGAAPAAAPAPAPMAELPPYPADWATHRYTKPMMVYNENLGASRNSVSGKRFPGTPAWREAAFADGTPVRGKYPEADWPLQLISYKSPLQNSYSIGARRLRGIHPDNPVALHADDAARFGVQNGDRVYLETPGGRAKATVIVRHGVQRGVIAVEHGFGHREMGARAHRFGAVTQPGEAAIAAGVNLNDLGLSDPTRSGRNVYVDPVSGSAVRQGLPARIVRA
ncbi:molybdopterin dinucleotide binding domain-containing protein [Janthinobacterium fluminis]|uniref:Molybdopterin-dependent oxidoreductase n=1 Tax=Janthinobacterium fluminis TaxID=2987524 RepID=A0ABT5K861_9BURK|nr:molybdopterin dinucleotide binding domain-containing protein [Janthinobacterium fluminis]MDC8760256.1 molybdopterin-dependent oxidoreductase [Janthinobacterium fluminis]